jgi:prepilin-type processing-associated H-X9-DG protein
MADEPRYDAVAETMRRINQAWLDGHVEDLASMVHPEMVMVFPGFAGRMQGREAFLAGFRDFCQNAKVHSFREDDHQVDVAGSVAAVTFRYEMVYERSRQRFRSTGRDLWVFQSHNKAWVAVWRTMLDVAESPA